MQEKSFKFLIFFNKKGEINKKGEVAANAHPLYFWERVVGPQEYLSMEFRAAKLQK
jgi:hypothetical protein